MCIGGIHRVFGNIYPYISRLKEASKTKHEETREQLTRHNREMSMAMVVQSFHQSTQLHSPEVFRLPASLVVYRVLTHSVSIFPSAKEYRLPGSYIFN